MTQEEKQLLLKELCARLPYGVKVDINFYDNTKELNCSLLQDYIVSEKSLRPYLRPMSSMTQDEIDEYNTELDKDFDIVLNGALDKDRYETSDGKHNFSKHFVSYFGNDWLNSHHFDYRGLIPMGLALEAPEGMYKTI